MLCYLVTLNYKNPSFYHIKSTFLKMFPSVDLVSLCKNRSVKLFYMNVLSCIYILASTQLTGAV